MYVHLHTRMCVYTHLCVYIMCVSCVCAAHAQATAAEATAAAAAETSCLTECALHRQDVLLHIEGVLDRTPAAVVET